MEDDLRQLMNNVNNIATMIDATEADLEKLHQTIEFLVKQEQALKQHIEKASRSSTQTDAGFSLVDLQRALDQVVAKIATLMQQHVRKPAGPPEIAPEEIIFDKKKDKLASGAYGTVYKGFCRGLNVAVKVPIRQHMSEVELRNFRNEVNIMRHIFHPNAVLFLGACTQPGNVMIVTELMKTDLDQLLHHAQRADPEQPPEPRRLHLPDPRSITPVQRMKMAKEAALGVSWLHGICKIIHRDLKPANLLIADLQTFTVKVTDFGFSETLKADRKLIDRKGPKGTALYMAPEVMRQDAFNEKSDVYSFGLILWELYSGEELFPQYDDLDPFIKAICYDNERPPIPEGTPPSLAALMTACWEPDPNKRPDMKEVVYRLDEVLVDCAITEAAACAFWKQNFVIQKQYLPLEVAWEVFQDKLQQALAVPVSECASLAPLIGSIAKGTDAANPHPNRVVSIERFELVVKWFGLFFVAPQGQFIIKEMSELLTRQWFHGDISKETAERRLRGRAEANTFLVRLSLGDPTANPFTISKIRGTNITHKRVTRLRAQGSGPQWSVPVDNSSQQFRTIVEMIDELKRIRNLGPDCPPNELAINSYVND